MATRNSSKIILPSNPKIKANPINKLFFWWTVEIFRKSSRRNLDMNDLYLPLPADESEYLGNRLQKAWNEEIKKSRAIDEYKANQHRKKNINSKKKLTSIKPSLTKAIFRTFWWEYLYISILILFQTVVLRTIQPVFQSWIVTYFDNSNKSIDKIDAVSYTIGLIITILAITFIYHHMNLASQQIGMRIRVACCSLIYRKSLKLSQLALTQTAAGQMINLLSNDVNRFDLLPMVFNYLWIMPIQIVVISCLLWEIIGLSFIVGIGVLLLMCVPIQSCISRISGKLIDMISQLTDIRIQLMNELITGIQTIKMYTWEKLLGNMVSRTRLSEIKLIRFSSYLRGFYISLGVFTERTTLFATLVSYSLMGNHIDAQTTFALAGYFNILQMIAVIFFPQALIWCSEAASSIARIQDFLLLEEIMNSPPVNISSVNVKMLKEQSEPTQRISTPVSIELKRISASWISAQLPPTLCQVSFKINGGQLCGLIGPVGCGKSSLLNVLLQELPLGAGTIKFSQSSNEQLDLIFNDRGFIKDNPNLTVSYASQDPWLFSGTIRENILFGQNYDKKRYREVTEVCSLLRDFQQLPNGDMTMVGDRGTSLSGGQRARINLARAIYCQADLYLLDDPLSAVDAPVARNLFHNCIVHYLQGKTRILVTHQIHFLKHADVVAVMENGGIKEQGTFESLMKINSDFNQLINQLKDDESTMSLSENDIDNDEVKSLQNQDMNFFRGTSLRSSRRISVKSYDSHLFTSNMCRTTPNVDPLEPENETIITGKLSYKIYIRYFRNGGSIVVLILLIINFLLSQVATSGGDYWLSYWTNLESVRNCLHDSKHQCTINEQEYNSIVNNTLFSFYSILDEDGLLPTNYAIYIYAVWIICCIIFSISRSLFFMTICVKAGKRLHDNMFSNIIHTTMFFFNANPSGRILNRFSKDIGGIDEFLPRTALEFLQIFLVIIGILILIVIVNPWMTIPIIIIGIIFYIIQTYAIDTIQNMRRLESTAKSPLFSHANATWNGLSTIRSRGSDIESMLCKQFDEYQNYHSSAWYMSLATASAFGFILDFISCIFVSCVCFSFILIDRDNAFGGSVGLAISQSLILTGMLQYGVQQANDIQSQMTAVERIIEYTDLPKETFGNLSPSLPKNWPARGRIQMKRVFFSYRNGDPPVLKNLDLTIEGGWKVGVVGRTGAGKSSIIAALFRLTDDGLQGEIIIDGKDTMSIGLEDLRTSISIIPQQPILFSESLRFNLDPHSKYSDDVLYNVLREVELNELSLDQWIDQGGKNFSVGQRQLICLARVILKNNRILILDEATANIDSGTDALIQRTIRSKFANCTVITVAHRLNTIIDSDKVVVMENGRIVEFASPYELLFEEPQSQFRQMVEQTGKVMAKKLLEDAKTYHNLHSLYS